MKVGVVGCGVAGQAAAILLADAGHAVTVFERFAEPRPIGAGLLLQPTGLAVLRELGLADAALAQGARVVGLEGRTQRGRRVLDLRYADLHPKAFGLGIRRSALFDLLHGRLLRSQAKLVTGAEIVDVAQGSVVDKQGATHGPFDLVVIADGAHSALRARLMPGARAPVYPWGCIWTTVPDLAGLGTAGLLRQRVHGTTVMMGLLPVGQGQMTMFWSLPVEALARRQVDRPFGLAPRRSGDVARGRRARRPRRRSRRLRARDLPPRRPAALERRAGAVHRRRRPRHQPAAGPGRQSRPARRPCAVLRAGGKR